MREDGFAGHLVALCTIFVWGTTFVSTKVLLRDFVPIEILFFRFLLGFCALALIYPRVTRLRERRHELLFMGAGLTGITLYFLLENIALSHTLASNVGVICSLAPFFTAVAAHVLLRGERLTRAFFAGFIISISGVVLLSLHTGAHFQVNPLGDCLALAASMVWAFYAVLTRKIGALGYHPIQATRRSFFWGLLFMLPVLPLSDFQFEFSRMAKLVNLANILFLGLCASALCFVSWNVAVRLLGAIRTSAYIYLIPVVTVATSVIVLHEPLTPAGCVGMGLTLLGLAVSEGRAGIFRRGREKCRETYTRHSY